MSKRFLYFAYCANMLSNRMECCIGRTVKRYGVGKLEDYKVMFGKFSPVWYGTLPTIVKNCDCVTWGSLWSIENCLRPKLDELMGVGNKVYQPVTVKVKALQAKGGLIDVLTYKLVDDPQPPELKEDGKWKLKYRPSKIFQEELVEGAEESCLPLYYKKWLRNIPNNGYTGSVKPSLNDDDIYYRD